MAVLLRLRSARECAQRAGNLPLFTFSALTTVRGVCAAIDAVDT